MITGGDNVLYHSHTATLVLVVSGSAKVWYRYGIVGLNILLDTL